MAAKRKDNKGRILKTGESQRPNNTYQFRYKDIRGKTRYVYAPTLDELRAKEELIQREVKDGIDYYAGEISVSDLVKKYISQKQGVRYNTQKNYNFVSNILQNSDFGYCKIKAVKHSDAKQWLIELSRQYTYSSVAAVRGVLRPAFDMAIEEDAVRKNPFSFKLSSIITKDTQKRGVLSPEEQARLLEYVSSDKCRSRYYDEIVILLGTGLRVSELYGLTKSDIDFDRQRIRVERQLLRTLKCGYYIQKPKTACGMRYVPMSPEVLQAFRRVMQKPRPVVEFMVSGFSGFLFLDKDGKPKVAGHLEHAMKRFIDKYNAANTDQPLKVTPHVLRHTFCTNMVMAGLAAKELQSIMGHEDISTTLGVYTHTNYEITATAFQQAVAKSVGL